MKTRVTLIFALLATMIAMTSLFVQAQDDGRINMVGHFGGDNLYCDATDGCTLLNDHGEFLWNVPQATIDETFAMACEDGFSYDIEAGWGTYGPSVLHISCYEGYEPTLTLKAFDEHGKINEIQFPQNYVPVMPMQAHSTAVPTMSPTSTPIPTCYASVSALSICPANKD
ncbi:hypothetical protein G4Y79_03345 [Phototrophicus methaneseepsis]|uniref:Secreted protein n=1 Tax=Phototrophicus methaneseepsis TaxID=2710758 RepID=A0A7S8IFB7_9CHLR|nr:hypothetical protein [Phototrophicus methaneseepsis]QPC83431.1 hypothetical protein G4Y79_03345 [Phototrophicus methaneseepsis]